MLIAFGARGPPRAAGDLGHALKPTLKRRAELIRGPRGLSRQRACTDHECVFVELRVWLRAVEGRRPDRWDLTAATIAVVGALVIILGRSG